MTKTQALQRLYKALTNKDGRNTSTKVIEDLAVAAENGDIGGGGFKAAKVHINCEGTTKVQIAGVVCGVEVAGQRDQEWMQYMEMLAPEHIENFTMIVPIVIPESDPENAATSMSITASGGNTNIEGLIESDGVGQYLIYGDCSVTVKSSGGGNAESV